MRLLVWTVCLAFLSGCASAPSGGRRPAESAKADAILKPMRLTLDIRYRKGETLSLESRVAVISRQVQVTTRLSECGATAEPAHMRFTTGGLVHPGVACHILVAQPDEPAQVFDVLVPRRSEALGRWSEWYGPAAQIVSPTPAQSLLRKPEARLPLTLPPARRFEIRHMLTPWNAPDPKTD